VKILWEIIQGGLAVNGGKAGFWVKEKEGKKIKKNGKINGVSPFLL